MLMQDCLWPPPTTPVHSEEKEAEIWFLCLKNGHFRLPKGSNILNSYRICFVNLYQL